jgi:GNAT superfamily N-acetyltransferase
MQVFPDRGIALEEIGGATVAYCAPQSNFNKAIGLGLRGTVGEDDVERIVEFFHSRGETARVDITPVGDAALAAKLGRRGFVLDDYENALVADLTEISGRRDARVEASTDPDEWSRGFGRAVTAGGVPGEKRPFMRFVMATHPEIIPLLLREDGRIVTTGCLGIEAEGFAGFFSTSTAQDARGRGYQSALIGDRIARAQELGKSIARATAEVGSTSERNFRRFGFTPIFTRTIWILPRANVFR